MSTDMQLLEKPAQPRRSARVVPAVVIDMHAENRIVTPFERRIAVSWSRAMADRAIRAFYIWLVVAFVAGLLVGAFISRGTPAFSAEPSPGLAIEGSPVRAGRLARSVPIAEAVPTSAVTTRIPAAIGAASADAAVRANLARAVT